jgi:2-haloacid dehalogenase
MTFQIEPKTTTRRDLLMIAGAAAATGGVAKILGTDAFAQTIAGKIKAVGFDAFTIFSPLSVDAVIDEYFPGKGSQLATAWRVRIFEYCWLRTLNQTYVDFWQILDDALVFVCKAAKIELKADARDKFMDAFLNLKPWPDSIEALKSMQEFDLLTSQTSHPGYS